MREVFRFFVTRNPGKASPAARAALGVALHGRFEVSSHHARLRALAGDRDAMAAAAAAFVNSPDFLAGIDGLHQRLAAAVSRAAAVDFRLDAIAMRRAVDEFGLDRLVGADNAAFVADWNRTADSITALVLLRRLGVADAPYVAIARTLAALAHAAAAMRDGTAFTAHGVASVFTSPVVLDPTLFRRGCDPAAATANATTASALPATGAPASRAPCVCACSDACIKLGRCCTTVEPYIADLLLLRETTVRYEAGDLAYIENVLRGETRTRDHRHLERTEDLTQTEITELRSEERDHQVTERFSLESRASEVIQQDLAIDAGVNFSGKLGADVTFSTNFGVATTSSSTSSNEIARTYARDVVSRAVTKLQREIRELRSRRVVIESEEKNQHVLSNVPGADHITGMYHWVNRISRGQVMGYGKRLMFDLVVPEPAEPYKRLSTVAVAPAGAPATIDLAAIVAGPGAVTRANYLDLLAHPALVALDAGGISAPPPAEVILTCAMSGVEQPAASHAGPLVLDVKDLMIPEKYQTISFSVFAKTTWNQLQQDQFNQGDNAKDLFVQIGYASSYLHGGNSAEQDRPLPGLSGQLHVMAHAWGANSTTVTLWIRCALTVEAYQSWQLDTYGKIKAAVVEHNRQIAAATRAPAAAPAYLAVRNPVFHREIERTELVRLAITMIACEHFDGYGAMKRRVEPCGYPDVDVHQANIDGRVIQFLQQAIEWRFLSYVFYPYVWGAQCSWPEKVQLEHGDPLFEKFLRAGAARVTAPVREGFEELVAYFLATGEIWGGSDAPPAVGSDHFLSLLQEIKEDRGCHYSDRDGAIDVSHGSADVTITTTYYLDANDAPIDTLVANDVSRELVLDARVYRIVALSGGPLTWTATLDRPYEGATAAGLGFLVGAKHIGAPWEIVQPTSLVYLRNSTTQLPAYPL